MTLQHLRLVPRPAELSTSHFFNFFHWTFLSSLRLLAHFFCNVFYLTAPLFTLFIHSHIAKMSITWQDGDNSPIRCPLPKTRSKPRKNVVATITTTTNTISNPAVKRKAEQAGPSGQSILQFPKRRVKRNYQDEDVSPGTLAGMPLESLEKKAKWYLITISKKFQETPHLSNPLVQVKV